MAIPPRMTPRERVLAATHHRQPDRNPFSWGFGPTPEMSKVLEAYCAQQGLDWARLRAAVNDVAGIGPAYVGPAIPHGDSMWGYKMKPMSYGSGSYDEFTYFPLAGTEDVAAIEAFPWPDPAWFDDSQARDAVLAADPERLFARKIGGGNPFEIYCWMTGLEESMMNVVANPEVVVAALERITGFFTARLRNALAQYGDLVDLVFLADDLGGQQTLLMSRESYRAVLQPFHRQLTDTIHEYAPNAKIMFHSDGAVFDILPDLLDAGIDILEAVQTDAGGMDPASLKQTFGDRLGFHGAISVQDLLPHHDAQTVEEECRRLVKILGGGGGYIAAPAHAIQMGTPPENVFAMLRGVLGEEDYQVAISKSVL
ncbi:MAG: uroporphyrinogen decarboxylase family protein [Armatimonadota bacterium]